MPLGHNLKVSRPSTCHMVGLHELLCTGLTLASPVRLVRQMPSSKCCHVSGEGSQLLQATGTAYQQCSAT